MTTNTNGRPGRKPAIRQSLELPMPTGRHPDVAWLQEAAGDLARQRAALVPGFVRVHLQAGIDQGSALELTAIARPLLELLCSHGVIEEREAVSDLALRWDRTVPPGRVRLELSSTTAPHTRIGSATRARISAAQRARWAAVRAARAAV